jgi:hypothetical protein
VPQVIMAGNVVGELDMGYLGPSEEEDVPPQPAKPCSATANWIPSRW